MSLASRSTGDGPPIILLNGYAATSADWDPTFLSALAAGGTIVCPDLPGMGDSPLGGGEATIEAMAAEVLATLDDLGVDSAPVIGWSMGGFVAQELARSAPDRVESMTLISSDPGGEGAERTSAEDWAALTDRSGTPREQASRLIGLLFPPEFAEAVDRDFGDVVAQARDALDPAALDAQERAMDAWHEGETPEPPEVPTLAAAGELDRVIPPGNAYLMIEQGGWLATFAGGGHAFMAQEPQRLAALILAFCGRGSAAAPA
jgi:pimeloyl-ACP methyl ester carboxylesterase